MTPRFTLAWICSAVALSAFAYAEEPIDIAADSTTVTDDSSKTLADDPSIVRTLKQFGGSLKIEGDIRLKYKMERARDGDEYFVGSGTALSDKALKDEVNLYLYYNAPRTIAQLRLKFDNSMGIIGGTTNKISTPQAFWGYEVLKIPDLSVKFGLGRRSLGEMLESDVAYGARMDGGYLRLSTYTWKFSDLSLDFIASLVDINTTQIAYFGQFSMENIMSTGLYFRYSIGDWFKSGQTRITNGDGDPVTVGGISKMRNNPQNAYITSQVLVGYSMAPWKINIPVRLYGAFLMNHKASPQPFLNNKKENTAWYVGARIGSGKKPKSFSIECSYEFVRAQAIQQLDVSGIGNGNKRDNSFYGPLYDDFTGAEIAAITSANANGNTNFKGVKVGVLYRFTKEMSAKIIYSTSKRANANIGPDRHFNKFDVQMIYAF